MDLAAPQGVELFHSQFRGGVGGGADGQGDKHLIRVETGVAVAQMIHLQVLDGLNDDGGDEMEH